MPSLPIDEKHFSKVCEAYEAKQIFRGKRWINMIVNKRGIDKGDLGAAKISELYGGTVKLIFDPAKHVYTLDGQKLSGVTTVLATIAKPALVYWSAKCAGDHIREKLSPGIALDEVEIESLAKAATFAHRTAKDKAADMGTFVHKWIERHVSGKKPPMPQNPLLKQAIEQFLEFWSSREIEVVHVERPLCSPSLCLAGTPDLICRVDGKLTIMDWKTGSGLYPDYLLQLGAYAMMYREEFGEDIEQLTLVNASVRSTFKVFSTESVKDTISSFTTLMAFRESFDQVQQLMK